MVMRVSGEDSKILAPTFDTTPQPALVGEEPVRAPVADPITHLTRHGHPNPTIAQLVSDYLMPLETPIKKGGSSSPHVFNLAAPLCFPPGD